MAMTESRSTPAQRALLLCGALATLTYAVADVTGGLVFPGYSFRDMAVSELMAAGAPSERIVDPIFLLYDVLLILFGIAVIRDSRANRPLRYAGALLLASAVVGLTGPTFFEMHPRGTAGVNDVPHIVATIVIVLLLLSAMSFGAFAFGKKFRIYSFVTIALMLAFGVLGGMAGAPLARQEPTPWLGVFERIDIYVSMLWAAALSFGLARDVPAQRVAA